MSALKTAEFKIHNGASSRCDAEFSGTDIPVCLEPKVQILRADEYIDTTQTRMSVLPHAAICVCAVFLAMLVFLTSIATAETTISFPLQGYYRTGKYMPVRISHDGAQTNLSFTARGALETHISPRNGSVVFPWLMIDPTIENASWSDGTSQHPIDQTFRVVGPNERLIGSVSSDIGIAQSIFPSAKLIHIPIDPANLLDQPLVAAWEALDVVILNSSQALDNRIIEGLLADGTAIVVRGPPPDTGWSWQWEVFPSFSVLRYSPAGPKSVVSEAAYSPTYAWKPALPTPVRRRIFLLGLIFTLITFGSSLYLYQRTTWIVFAVAVASLGTFAALRARQTPIRQQIGHVLFKHHNLQQIDEWTYQTSRPASVATLDAGVRPIFASNDHVMLSGIKLVCGPAGGPRQFEYRLGSDMRIAFVKRRVMLNATPWGNPSTPTTSPMLDVARRIYLTPGSQLEGQIDQDSEDWPTVVIQEQ